MTEIRDKSGLTAEEWGKSLFEFEYCAECGGDWPDHDYVLVLGGWFAGCRSKNIQYMLDNPDKWILPQYQEITVVEELS